MRPVSVVLFVVFWGIIVWGVLCAAHIDVLVVSVSFQLDPTYDIIGQLSNYSDDPFYSRYGCAYVNVEACIQNYIEGLCMDVEVRV